MKILAFDTSFSNCSIALQIGDNIITSHEIAPMQQARLILPVIQKMLHQANMTLNGLDAIAYGCGPGSFTGIRIANSVAQGLGFAANKPIIRISSLAALAQSAYDEHGYSPLLVAVDARMQQVYWAVYSANNTGLVELQGLETLSAPSQVTLKNLGSVEWYGIGDAWTIYGQELTSATGVTVKITNTTQLSNATALIKLAQAQFDKGEWVQANNAIPEYLIQKK